MEELTSEMRRAFFYLIRPRLGNAEKSEKGQVLFNKSAKMEFL